jgi:adenosylcobinamide-GDP ribazoletransferase
MFLTRIPTPRVEYSEVILNDSSRFFPLVGALLGVLSFGIYFLSQIWFPNSISILLSMIFTVLVTGGFHEDGLADSCDAFGGGYTKVKVLEIMKDSRIGSFGALGLIFILFLKFQTLSSISTQNLFFAMVLGHSWSRIVPIWIMLSLNYVQFEGKSKPIAKEPSLGTVIFSHLTLLLVCVIMYYFEYNKYYYILPLFVFTGIFVLYLKKRIGGYTGDTLGASQQIAEVLIYLGCVLWF